MGHCTVNCTTDVKLYSAIPHNALSEKRTIRQVLFVCSVLHTFSQKQTNFTSFLQKHSIAFGQFYFSWSNTVASHTDLVTEKWRLDEDEDWDVMR